MDGIRDDGLEGPREVPAAVAEVGGEAQPHDAQVHHLLQLLHLQLDLTQLRFCRGRVRCHQAGQGDRAPGAPARPPPLPGGTESHRAPRLPSPVSRWVLLRIFCCFSFSFMISIMFFLVTWSTPRLLNLEEKSGIPLGSGSTGAGSSRRGWEQSKARSRAPRVGGVSVCGAEGATTGQRKGAHARGGWGTPSILGRPVRRGDASRTSQGWVRQSSCSSRGDRAAPTTLSQPAPGPIQPTQLPQTLIPLLASPPAPQGGRRPGLPSTH